MEPAQSIVSKFGSAYRLAQLTLLAPSTVLRWTKPKEKGGTGGIIPFKHHADVLSAAKRAKVKLKPTDFLPQQ